MVKFLCLVFSLSNDVLWAPIDMFANCVFLCGGIVLSYFRDEYFSRYFVCKYMPHDRTLNSLTLIELVMGATLPDSSDSVLFALLSLSVVRFHVIADLQLGAEKRMQNFARSLQTLPTAYVSSFSLPLKILIFVITRIKGEHG